MQREFASFKNLVAKPLNIFNKLVNANKEIIDVYTSDMSIERLQEVSKKINKRNKLVIHIDDTELSEEQLNGLIQLVKDKKKNYAFHFDTSKMSEKQLETLRGMLIEDCNDIISSSGELERINMFMPNVGLGKLALKVSNKILSSYNNKIVNYKKARELVKDELNNRDNVMH